MKLITGSEIDITRWRELIELSEFSSPFQTSDFYHFLKSDKNYNAEVFAYSESEKLKALILVTIFKEPGVKGFFSKRGIVFGGPVLYNISKNEFTAFLKAIKKELSGKIIYLETRNFFDYSEYTDCFKENDWLNNAYLNFRLDVSNFKKDQILSLFKYNRRREIKQSVANAATYSICNNKQNIKEVYDILEELYKTKVKLPLPPLDYFLGLYEKNILKVFIVKHKNKVIGGSFCPVLANKNLYTYYYCGLRNYHNRIFPTHLAILAAIEYAIENGIPVIDFMGAGKPNIDYGVRKYKSEFGGEQVDYGRFLFIFNPFLYALGKTGLKIISKFGR
jgi:lipid II:glycine glycyltransferase (peptidoglycan interpeptide bridge formation enzyme)